MIRKEDDVQIKINSKLNLIEGFKKVGENRSCMITGDNGGLSQNSELGQLNH